MSAVSGALTSGALTSGTLSRTEADDLEPHRSQIGGCQIVLEEDESEAVVPGTGSVLSNTDHIGTTKYRTVHLKHVDWGLS